MSLDPNTRVLHNAWQEQNHDQFVETVHSQILTLDDDDKYAAAVALRQDIVTGEPPRNAEELYQCIEALFGVAIPYTVGDARDEFACSPFEWIHNVFFNVWPISLAWAGRGGGKTWLMAVIQYLLGTFYPKHEGIHAGGIDRQAAVASQYLQDFVRDPALKAVFRGLPGARKASWKNGSRWAISPGKYKSIDGQHPNTLSMDEVKHWDRQSLDQCWGLPSEKNGYPQRWIMGSTNQYAGGGFQFLLDEAESRHIHIAKWNALDVMKPCQTCKAIDENPFVTGNEGDNLREQSCLMWRFCKGERGRKVTGWKTRESVENFIRSLGGPNTQETKTQAYCSKPSTRGLVVHNFEHEYRKFGGNLTTYGYDETGTFEWYVAYDPAEGKKSVLWFIHVAVTAEGPIAWVFDQIVDPECPTASKAKADFYKYCKEKGYRDPNAIIVDPRKSDAISDWRSGTVDGEGLLHFYNAIAPDITNVNGGQEIATGVDELRKFICDGSGVRRFYVNPDAAPDLITAIQNHYYVTTPEGEPTDKVKAAYKDEIDAWRYFARYFRMKFMRRQSNGPDFT